MVGFQRAVSVGGDGAVNLLVVISYYILVGEDISGNRRKATFSDQCVGTILKVFLAIGGRGDRGKKCNCGKEELHNENGFWTAKTVDYNDNGGRCSCS